MLPAKLRGYCGEKSFPVSPVMGIMLSRSGSLHGPMEAKKIQRELNLITRRLEINKTLTFSVR